MESDQPIQEQAPINLNQNSNDTVAKRRRGRPLKNKNQHPIPPSHIQNNKFPSEIPLLTIPELNHFTYPPEISFNGFDVSAISNYSRFSSSLLIKSLQSSIEIWWSGKFPVIIDDTNFIKYDILYQFLNTMNNYFKDFNPILLICNQENEQRWMSTFHNYDCGQLSTTSQQFKANNDIYIVSTLSLVSELPIKSFNLAIFDNVEIISDFAGLNIKSSVLITNSQQHVELPSNFNVESPITINLSDIKTHFYLNETVCFCPMSVFQISQLQQLFKSIKSRLVAISNTPSERLSLFISHMIEQVRSLSVQPSSHSQSFSGHDEPSGKLEKLLEIVSQLQETGHKISILATDPQFLNSMSTFFNKNEIDAFSVNFTLKNKKRIQYIDEFNDSDSSSVLLIDPTHFLEFIPNLEFDTLIILDADISLTDFIDPILDWMKKNHDIKPQIYRLITDNSIELPIYEMQFEDKKGEFNIEKVNSETSLLLLKQSAYFCFNYDNFDIKKSIEVCYSCPTPIFTFETEFSPDFWNEITEIEQKKRTQPNQSDDLSIAARMKKAKENPVKNKKVVDTKQNSKEEKQVNKSNNRQSPRVTNRQSYADIPSEDYDEYVYEYEYQFYEYETQSETEKETHSEAEDESEDDPNLSIGERRRRRIEKQQNKNKSKSKEEEQKSSKSKTIEKNVDVKSESQMKQKKHVPKFDAMVSFWTNQQFNMYFTILRDFGFDRWEKFGSFNRPVQELRKIGALIIRNLETTSKENRLLREYFANELRSSELSRLDNAMPFVGNKIFKAVTREEFLADLTGMLMISRMQPKSPKDIILPKLISQIGPFDDKWTEDDDRTLLYMIYEHGLRHFPQTLRHGKNEELINRFRQMFLDNPSLNQAKSSYDLNKKKIKEKPSYLESKSVILSKTKSTTEAEKPRRSRAIGLKEHDIIIKHLCSYGFPSLDLFKSQVNLPETISDDNLQDYINHIIQFCQSNSNEEKKIIQTHLAGKIEKYTTSKILMRISMFEKLRNDSIAYNEFAQDHIEILSAMSFHGFQNTDMSPILLSLCNGKCSDSGLYQRAKGVREPAQNRHSYLSGMKIFPENETNPEDLFPLKVNEMQVLKSIGKIDPRFHNKDYVYPIDYEIAVGCTSPFSDAGLIWLNASIRLNQAEDKLQFVVRKEKEKSAEIVDDSPDLVFEKVRQKIIKRNRMWIPPIDGHEMFGLKSRAFHQLLLDLPNIEQCDQYQKRFFYSPLLILHDWPVLGRFDKKMPAFYGSVTPSGEQSSKAMISNPRSPSIRKKDFGPLIRPLVFNCRPIFAAPQETASVSVSGNHLPFDDIMNRYQEWDKDTIRRYSTKQNDQ